MFKKTILSLLLFVLEAPAYAATWYAAASNSTPAGAGTACTQAAPCTFSYGLGTKMAAGDNLLLYPGTYTDQNINISKSNVTI